MYTPSHFDEADPIEIERLMDGHPLALVIAQVASGLVANPIPLLRDGPALVGHVALANPLHEELADAGPVLAVFSAGEGYVSPNWYPTKAETHRAVPTWNYRIVQVHGRLIWSHAERDKRRAVSLLTTRMERAVNGEAGWRMGDAPADYLQGMLDRIVAFRIEIDRISAKSKLNQNHPEANRRAVAGAFDAQGRAAMAEAMRRTLTD